MEIEACRAALLSASLEDVRAALATLDRHPTLVGPLVPELVLRWCLHDTVDTGDVGYPIVKAIERQLMSVLGATAWASTRESVRVLFTARVVDEYADSGTFAKAITNALPTYAPVRDVYEPIILGAAVFHAWYHEIGLVLARSGDGAGARSYWQPFVDGRIANRDVLAELGFFACRWGEPDRAQACLALMLEHFPDDEAVARLRTRIAAVRSSGGP